MRITKDWNIDLNSITATHKSGAVITAGRGRREKGLSEWYFLHGNSEGSLMLEGIYHYEHYYSKNYLCAMMEKLKLSLEEIVSIANKHINERDPQSAKISLSELQDYLSDERYFDPNVAGLIRSALYFYRKVLAETVTWKATQKKE